VLSAAPDAVGGRRIGLPRLHKEAGERRDFLPDLVGFLDRIGAEEVVVEDGYGSGMNLPLEAYTAISSKVRVGSCADCYAQDVVVALRCPGEETIRTMRRGAVLVSMLHLPTRPGRARLLRELGVRAVSLDSVKDDLGNRLVQNMVRAAFGELAKTLRHFDDPRRRPIRVTLLGSGAVGGHAAHAAIRYGDVRTRQRLAAKGVPGVELTMIDYELTSDERYMLTRLENTDLLIDATMRKDPSRPVIVNEWIGSLPAHAVILDLSVDPYDFTLSPPEVKGIEGIPEGNLDQYIFAPDDPAYARIDPRIQTRERRTALSCYSWPGLDPKQCMEVYGKQIEPVLRAIVETGLERLDPETGPYYERATARADVARWSES
jgi:alanine dehydrogenase